MQKKIIDITGKRFGKLIAIKYLEKTYWLCKCDCGKTKKIRGSALRGKTTKSCGCLIGRKKKHGYAGHDLFKIWHGMKRRCDNPIDIGFKHYGGRGIKVCKRWYVIANFIADMAPRPKGFQIDRIDNNGDYCKENCQWLSPKENSRKRRNAILLTFGKQTHCLGKWAEILNCSIGILRKRLNKGWSHKDILITPIKKYNFTTRNSR